MEMLVCFSFLNRIARAVHDLNAPVRVVLIWAIQVHVHGLAIFIIFIEAVQCWTPFQVINSCFSELGRVVEFCPVVIIAHVHANSLIHTFLTAHEVAITWVHSRLPLDFWWVVLDFLVNVATHAEGNVQTSLFHVDVIVLVWILPGNSWCVDLGFLQSYDRN